MRPAPVFVTVGAAAVGGLVGVQLFGDVITAAELAGVFAYGSTMDNKFGQFTTSAGTLAAKTYSKTLEINEQYDVLPKAKGAADTISVAAGNLNNNYGITASLDEKLQLSAAVDKAGAKFDELKGSVTDKVEDLKSKATA